MPCACGRTRTSSRCITTSSRMIRAGGNACPTSTHRSISSFLWWGRRSPPPKIFVQGTIVQVSVSGGGVPKLPVPSASIGPLGLDGDSHAHPQIHGGPDKAVLLVTLEGIHELIERGYSLFPGAL